MTSAVVVCPQGSRHDIGAFEQVQDGHLSLSLSGSPDRVHARGRLN
jgi:hypothetical protein